MQKLLVVGLCCWLGVASADTQDETLFPHPFYIGGMGGYGATTWNGLVPQAVNQNYTLNISTPTKAEEGGGVWGVVIGYEFIPYFALEANYMHFPTARVTFDEFSLFAFDQDGNTVLDTDTQTVSLNARVMLVLPKTSVRVFSSAGIASVFRNDQVNNVYRISPTFAFGINTLLTDRLLAELGTNYTAGYGESEINPVLDFVPFLYSVYIKLALRMG